ncbi:MAG: hypothetical protein ABSH39_08805 [Candidatus Acidiferrum sp.]|jgi:hypothetical protein
MKSVSVQIGFLTVFGVLTSTSGLAQNPAPSETQNPAPAPAASQPQDSSGAAPADAKKPKKVWTNDDVGSLNGSVSVVGNSKNQGKTSAGGKADGQYIANTKKELAKLQDVLDDTDKQLADLKDFSQGKAPATSSGYQINKGYNRVPVDQQITSLEDKKKQTQAKIDALFDEARKKGVLPGDLR